MCSILSCRGCCAGNLCLPPLSQNNFLCGSAGTQCSACNPGTTCSAGACTVTPNDAGTPAVGDACQSDAQCRPPPTGFCIAESVFGQPTGWPGGACTLPCTTGVCPAGSWCLNAQGANTPLCFASCPAPRVGQSTCRVGYVCEVNAQVAGAGVCVPRCNSPGFTCWQGSVCDPFSGYCIAVPP